MTLVVACLGFAVAGAAVLLRLPSRKAGLDRARWVSDLFGLVSSADAAGDKGVSSAARALITALIGDKGAG